MYDATFVALVKPFAAAHPGHLGCPTAEATATLATIQPFEESYCYEQILGSARCPFP